MTGEFASTALGLLRTLTGNATAEFLPDQLEAIHKLVVRNRRVLLVQRTGWGKIETVRHTEPQKTMQNSHRQYQNMRGAYRVLQPVLRGPVFAGGRHS